MQDCFVTGPSPDSTPIEAVMERDFDAWLGEQPTNARAWVDAQRFRAKPATFCRLPTETADPGRVVIGLQDSDDYWSYGVLPLALPEGDYHLAGTYGQTQRERAGVAWGLGAYEFTRYRASERRPARLVLGDKQDAAYLDIQVNGVCLARDLINTPAQDMMPAALGDAIGELGVRHDAVVMQTVGDELVEQNYPAIHAVGRASAHPPRLIDLRWGKPEHPQVALVGKGVCFDSGGLDLKNASGMRLMKKDMGGAAYATALAGMVMQAGLPVRLRLLVPAVENAVSADAYRPGDILMTRHGTTVEIDNTDAEGRVILCDALAEAASDTPELILDFATLTGAARVALGTELPAMFCNDDTLAEGLLETSRRELDPVWRLPLHTPYRELLRSKFADVANASTTPFGGAITAALFLQTFVPDTTPWAHFDTMAWNLRAKPGRAEGGEAMGLRGVFRYLSERYKA
jgi:leucyl aminopeptidase